MMIMRMRIFTTMISSNKTEVSDARLGERTIEI